MRFIFHDKKILHLTFQLLLTSMRASKGTFPKADLRKIELALKFFVNQFFKLEVDFEELRQTSNSIKALPE
jgi:hypothetical protein